MINVTRIFSQERLNIMNQNQINPEKEPLLSSSLPMTLLLLCAARKSLYQKANKTSP